MERTGVNPNRLILALLLLATWGCIDLYPFGICEDSCPAPQQPEDFASGIYHIESQEYIRNGLPLGTVLPPFPHMGTFTTMRPITMHVDKENALVQIFYAKDGTAVVERWKMKLLAPTPPDPY
jgi:hypothetical protein